MKIKREPWDDAPTIWKDEKAYLTWLRGSIRRIWSRSPVKIAYKQSRRYKAPVGLKGKEVWVSDCEMCGKQSRDCEVDHLHGGFGFTDWQSFTEWARMILWVSFDDIQELCPECHSVISYQQKSGLSFEDAKIEKQAIELCKKSVDKQWLLDNNQVPASSKAKRRQQIITYLKENNG